MKVSLELDNRFRDTAAAEGLLDVAYDLVDTPIGKLFVAATERGLCRISYDLRTRRREPFSHAWHTCTARAAAHRRGAAAAR